MAAAGVEQLAPIIRGLPLLDELAESGDAVLDVELAAVSGQRADGCFTEA